MHIIERASSGRAKCRGCGAPIAKGELRFGERLPNPFADEGGEMTHWYHPMCAAYRRPEAVQEFFAASDVGALAGEPDGQVREAMAREAALGVAHHRLPRANVAERAPTGRATCRACRALIDKDDWRISLVFYQDGRFTPGGFVHVRCAPAYFETTAFIPRLRHFSPGLSDADWTHLISNLST